MREDLRPEFENWLSRVQTAEAVNPQQITVADALRAHYFVLSDVFSAAAPPQVRGPRDEAVVKAALDRQFARDNGQLRWTSDPDVCAAALFGIIDQGPFQVGNSCTALLLCLYHLQKLNWEIDLKHKKLEELILRTDTYQLDAYSRYEKFADSPEPEIAFLSDFLRRCCRPAQRSMFTLSYRHLGGLLKTHGAWLDNAGDGSIDVMRETQQTRRRFLVFKESHPDAERVLELPFSDWDAEVSLAQVKQLRKLLALMPADGISDEQFFEGVDPMEILVSRYRNLLGRLADGPVDP